MSNLQASNASPRILVAFSWISFLAFSSQNVRELQQLHQVPDNVASFVSKFEALGLCWYWLLIYFATHSNNPLKIFASNNLGFPLKVRIDHLLIKPSMVDILYLENCPDCKESKNSIQFGLGSSVSI
jgi:hypothetical protein